MQDNHSYFVDLEIEGKADLFTLMSVTGQLPVKRDGQSWNRSTAIGEISWQLKAQGEKEQAAQLGGREQFVGREQTETQQSSCVGRTRGKGYFSDA